MLNRIVIVMLSIALMLNVFSAYAERVPSGEVQVHINPDTYVELYCNDGVDLVVVTDGESTGYAYCQSLEEKRNN